MRWFTSDTHFGHKNIIKFCDRPFEDVSHMNEMLIRNWNSVISPEDEVFHLGDVALGPWTEWHNILTRLNGFKTLVIGNHDRVFAGMREKERIKFEPEYAKWFDVVVDKVTNFRLSNGTNVNMSHFPYDGDHTGDDRYTEFRLPDDGKVLIHGHTHEDKIVSRSKNNTLQIHVGQDAWNYFPVSEDSVIKEING